MKLSSKSNTLLSPQLKLRCSKNNTLLSPQLKLRCSKNNTLLSPQLKLRCSKNNTLLSPQLKLRRLILIFLLIPMSVAAQINNPINATNFEDLLNGLSDFFFNFGLAFASIAIIAGAYYLITAGGEPAKIETGKKIIIYVLIGVSVLFLAKAIIEEILPALRNPSSNPYERAEVLIDPLFKILLAVAVLFIFYSAYTFITAGGEPGKTEAAKSGLIYALIGLVIAFMAKAIGALFH